jgi:hypothetical protein
MDDLTVLRDAFEELEPPAAALNRARAALLNHIHGVRPAPRRRGLRRRWRPLVPVAAALAAAAIAAVAVVHMDTDHSGTGSGTRTVAVPPAPGASGTAVPYRRPASAVQYLENAAWVARREQWTVPRPDQFMYIEVQSLHNDKALEDAQPNGRLVPGRTHVEVARTWKRIDGQVEAHLEQGRLVVGQQGRGDAWAQLPYNELTALDTPEKVLSYESHPTGSAGLTLDEWLAQYVLPPPVRSAVFRALAWGTDVRLDPDAVNIDGRPAVALILTEEGYISTELLFDKGTYNLIGRRTIVIADHTDSSLSGALTLHKGDLLSQEIYTASRIVDTPGQTG